jgi:hypothetical protein
MSDQLQQRPTADAATPTNGHATPGLNGQAHGHQHSEQLPPAAATDSLGAVPPPGANGTPPPASNRVPEELTRFVDTLFDRRRDKISVRPTETWTENGQKKSRVIHALALMETPDTLASPNHWSWLSTRAATARANLFFGVCPRPKKGCDRAWHIRTVRALWADLDHCTPGETLKRCEKAGLPRPSIITNSGNGVHLYWLLTEPYLIYDAGDPRPIGQYWVPAKRRDGISS